MNVAMICETKINTELPHEKNVPIKSITDRNKLLCKITYVAFSKKIKIYFIFMNSESIILYIKIKGYSFIIRFYIIFL